MFGRRQRKEQAAGPQHYVGTDRDGRTHEGFGPFGRDFVAFAFAAGWRALTLTDHEQVIGSIEERKGDTGRFGWALVPDWHDNDLVMFQDPHGPRWA